MDIEIISATQEQEPILANLLELYSHDFSEFVELKLGPDGRFGHKHLPLYWKDSGRYPFLILADGQWAGFVFVRKGSEISGGADVWDMAEFFIVRGFRHRGLGMKVARAIWKKFPGAWEIRVMDRNHRAVEFWARATAAFLGKPVEPSSFVKGGKDWRVFSFESVRAE